MRKAAFILSVISLSGSLSFAADAVYRGDTRQDLAEIVDGRVVEAAHSTVAMFKLKNLRPEKDAFFIDVTPMSKAMKICEDEKFAEQPSAAECSGVLVGKNRILTAGHCVSNWTCKHVAFAFGYAITSPKHGWPDRLRTEDVYLCNRILARSNEEKLDFAIVELDREVPNRRPLRLSRDKVRRGEDVYLLSHPGGLPLKYSQPNRVLETSDVDFKAEIDALGGSSGGAVFSAVTHDVVGILYAGGEDYLKDKAKKCRRIQECEPGECLGEFAVHSATIFEKLLQ